MTSEPRDDYGWGDFRTAVADLIYAESNYNTKPDGELTEWELRLYHLSEDCRGLYFQAPAISDLVNDIEKFNDDYDLWLPDLDEAMRRLVDLLEYKFNVSHRFWIRTANPQPHETARSYRVPTKESMAEGK